MTDGFKVPVCECSHLLGDHRSGGQGMGHRRVYGVCRRCECQRFHEASEDKEPA